MAQINMEVWERAYGPASETMASVPLQPTSKTVRKNLMFEFGENFSLLDSHNIVDVYLRIKPTKSEDDKQKIDEGLKIINNKSIIYETNTNHRDRNLTSHSAKFSFSHIYGPETTQSQLFETCIVPRLYEFFKSNGSSLLFCYGTTNAGKTFTVRGNAIHPGVIPRLFYGMFEAIKCCNDSSMSYKPEKAGEVVKLSAEQIKREMECKKKVLDAYYDQHYAMYSATQDTFKLCQEYGDYGLLIPQMKEHVYVYDVDSDFYHTIWISFAEIYNEFVYDLLDVQTKVEKRQKLKIVQDKNGNNYIEGLRYICVSSALEAYKTMMVGIRNLNVASTKLNNESSRSHSIFTIKLVKYAKIPEPNEAFLASFSICDLAGCERQAKTMNRGDRLKESGSINRSLHWLMRCFEVLRDNALKKERKRDTDIVPYRNCKLTTVFREALEGNGGIKVIMIVNVNPSMGLHDETLHVLKKSAIAHEVLKDHSVKEKGSVKMGRNYITAGAFETCGSSVASTWESELEPVSESSTEEISTSYDELYEEIARLRAKLDEQEKKYVTRTNEIFGAWIKDQERKDKSFAEQLASTEEFHKFQVEKTQRACERKYEAIIEDYKEKYADISKKLEVAVNEIAELRSQYQLEREIKKKEEMAKGEQELIKRTDVSVLDGEDIMKEKVFEMERQIEELKKKLSEYERNENAIETPKMKRQTRKRNKTPRTEPKRKRNPETKKLQEKMPRYSDDDGNDTEKENRTELSARKLNFQSNQRTLLKNFVEFPKDGNSQYSPSTITQAAKIIRKRPN